MRNKCRCSPSKSFPPGSAYRYSNSGYVLLGLIVERVSGVRFPNFLRARIFAPLGMTASVAHVEGVDTMPHRAYGYSPAPPPRGSRRRFTVIVLTNRNASEPAAIAERIAEALLFRGGGGGGALATDTPPPGG